jgi:hypothetical protein
MERSITVTMVSACSLKPFWIEYFTVEMHLIPGNLKVLETICLEEIPHDRTRISTFLHIQNMRFMSKLMGGVVARFLEARMKQVDHLAIRE